MYDHTEPKGNDRFRVIARAKPYMFALIRLHCGPNLEEAKLWVKVDFFWREKKSLAARGWASVSSYLHPRIIPSKAFVADKVVVSLV
jgi:hypothetical protein